MFSRIPNQFIQVLSPVSLHLSKKQPVCSIWSYLSQVMHSGFQSLLFSIGSQSASRMPFHIASSLSSIISLNVRLF